MKEQIFQIVCVVHDLDKVMDNWKKYVEFDQSSIRYSCSEGLKKMGEPYKVIYRDREVEAPFRQCRFNLGGIDMKIVQPLNSCGDPYSDVLAAQGQGFHHISVCVPDISKIVDVCKNWGCPPVAKYIKGEKTYLLFDLREKMGLEFEPWDFMVGPCGPRDVEGRTML